MRILGISGSLRAGSSNAALLHTAATLAPPGITFALAAPLDRLPHFNPDHDTPQVDAAVREWRNELAAADAVMISSPEYAHGIPGVLKNALDWDVSHGALYRKPVGLISA